MLMVVNLHTFFQPETLSVNGLTAGTLADYFRNATSISAVNLFVVISGYFSIKWRIKSFVSLVFQVFFWVFVLYSLLLFLGEIDFSLKTFLVRLNFVVTAYWFITAYIGLYLLSPLLNIHAKYINAIGGKKYLLYIILFFCLQFYYQLLGNSNFLGGYSILSFCGCYMIGRYIRMTDFHLSRCLTVLGIVVSTLFVMLSAIIGAFYGKYLWYYNNPFIIAQTVFIFCLFKGLRFQSKVVNWCSSSALAVYLLHMHPDIKQRFYDFAESLYGYSIGKHVVWLLIIFTTVFMAAILVDKVRLVLFDCLYKHTEIYIQKWKNK